MAANSSPVRAPEANGSETVPTANPLNWPETDWWRLETRGSGKALLVIFSALDVPHGSFSWYKASAGLDTDVLLLNCPDNGGFLGGIPGLGGSIEEAARSIGVLVARYQATGARVVFFGGSMGGPGAIAYAGIAGPDQVILIASELLFNVAGGLSQRFLGAHRHWLDNPAGFDALSRVYRGDVLLIAGANMVSDARCARHYQMLHQSARVVFLADVYHHAGNCLATGRYLAPLIRAALAGKPYDLPAEILEQRVPPLRLLAPFHEALYATDKLSVEQAEVARDLMQNWSVPYRAWGTERLAVRALESGLWRWAMALAKRPVASACQGIEWDAACARIAWRAGDKALALDKLKAASSRADWLYTDPRNALWRGVLKELGGEAPEVPAVGGGPEQVLLQVSSVRRDFGLPTVDGAINAEVAEV